MIEPKLDALLQPLIKEGIRLVPTKDSIANYASCESKFGGSPYAEKDDVWPVCPTCAKELTFIIQIFNQEENSLFVFYYCNECFPWGLEDEEKGRWLAKIYKSPTPEKLSRIDRKIEDEYALIPCCISYSSVNILPDWDSIDTYSDEVGNLCSALDEDSPWNAYEQATLRARCLNDYATLLGGYPRFVQSQVEPKCSKCNSDLEFYAQIDSEDDADVMWGDVGLVYFFQCPKHRDEFHLELQCH